MFAGASSRGTFPVLVGFCRDRARLFRPLCTHSSDVAKLKNSEKRLTKQYGGGSGSDGCGDDEPGDDEDGEEDEEDEEDEKVCAHGDIVEQILASLDVDDLIRCIRVIVTVIEKTWSRGFFHDELSNDESGMYPELPPIPANLVAKPGKPMDEKKVSKLEKQRMIRKEDETLCCGKTIIEQVHELQVLVNKLKALSVPITEAFQVGAILTKLPPSWKSFSKKMLNKTEDYSLDDLLKFLRIEEEG
ncbi:hypothetical protein Tco_0994425 [Tanacetum coccineum]